MLASLYAGISGLNVNSTAMTVIGDNIANVNTTAFKSTRTSFSNLLSQTLERANGSELGRGVQFAGTTASWTQGSMENTSSATDLAINGKGFFIVQGSDGLNYYTRAGGFIFDNGGSLITPDGLNVQGYEVNTVNPDGTFALDAIDDIKIPSETMSPPSPTTEFTVDVNLDAGAAVNDTYSTNLTIYDSLGNRIPINIDFVKTGNNEWTWQAASPDATAVVPATPTTITFDPITGALLGSTDPTITLTLSSGTTIPAITWDLYDGGSSKGDLTQFATPSTTTFHTQDGYPAGALRGVSVDEDGIVAGSYSNGQLVPLFQLALADFPSYYGLTKMGDNLYSQSLASGQAMAGTPGSGRLGNISPSALELSNVDLASEFVNMITTQRAFQANSRVITTSDEILTELINIKR
jgi:flagellar hook protein FlgE